MRYSWQMALYQRAEARKPSQLATHLRLPARTARTTVVESWCAHHTSPVNVPRYRNRRDTRTPPFGAASTTDALRSSRSAARQSNTALSVVVVCQSLILPGETAPLLRRSTDYQKRCSPVKGPGDSCLFARRGFREVQGLTPLTPLYRTRSIANATSLCKGLGGAILRSSPCPRFRVRGARPAPALTSPRPHTPDHHRPAGRSPGASPAPRSSPVLSRGTSPWRCRGYHCWSPG